MSEVKKKLVGLFRSRSEKEPKQDKERTRRRRDRPSTSQSLRSRADRSHKDIVYQHDSPRRSSSASARESPSNAPSKWPPSGLLKHAEISQAKALELIATGAPVFKGTRRDIPHASDEYYALYATADGNASAGTDRREASTGALSPASFRLQGGGAAVHPWESLEQPSLEFCYGTLPGTVTLNHWVSLSGKPGPTIELRDPGVRPREVEFSTIIERLIFLENGFEEDYEDLMYKNLYKNLLRDPDRHLNPHKAMEKQIADLIIVLSRPEWVDFSKPENQVVAKYFTNASYTDHGGYKAFFHQLLLSMELDFRINSKYHTEWAKEKLLGQLPPCIAWNLALARRWHETMTIENFKTDDGADKIRFHLRAKKAQVKALRKFARKMKWPNLMTLDSILQEKDADAKPLEDRSSDTMSYFTGMILPGPTLPWLIMNTLIDCDNDAKGLVALSHMHPVSGFQYRSTTYWSSVSIVGKVLAPSCNDLAGWIGPARPAPDLERSQIARIRQRRPRQFLSPADVKSMTIRSDPLGPPSDSYPVSEYELPLPDEEYVIDTIRVEKLALKPVKNSSRRSQPNTPENKTVGAKEKGGSPDDGRPLTYDAAVQFAIDGRSWPLRLSYDVSFIAAFPCARGPHPLFFDYVYKRVAIGEVLGITDWGGANGGKSGSSIGTPGTNTAAASSSGGLGMPGGLASGLPSPGAPGKEPDQDDEREKVLVVEAFGVSDNEVLARAWCSHWGLSAVVAQVEKTCMACAIREAYAACVNVVILIHTKDFEDAEDATR